MLVTKKCRCRSCGGPLFELDASSASGTRVECAHCGDVYRVHSVACDDDQRGHDDDLDRILALMTQGDGKQLH